MDDNTSLALDPRGQKRQADFAATEKICAKIDILHREVDVLVARGATVPVVHLPGAPVGATGTNRFLWKLTGKLLLLIGGRKSRRKGLCAQ